MNPSLKARSQDATTAGISSAVSLPAAMRSAALISLVFVLGACATTAAPTAQLAVSSAAVARAESAGGTEFASVELRSAREKLDRANAAVAAKNFDGARMLAHEAQVDAQLAQAKAESTKARRAADELTESNRVLRNELERKAP
jgi:hypothetical protein